MKNQGRLNPSKFKTVFAVGYVLALSYVICGQALAGGNSSSPGPLQKRVLFPKPAHSIIDSSSYSANVLYIKLKEGRKIRLRNGVLVDLDSSTDGLDGLSSIRPLLVMLNSGVWERAHYGVTEDRLDAMQVISQANTQVETPNLNLWFRLEIPIILNITAVVDALNALDIVEIAQAAPLVRPTTPGDYSAYGLTGSPYDGQGYINPANYNAYSGGPAGGIDARYVWNTYHSRGDGLQFGIVGYGFHNHVDLPSVTDLNAAGNYNPFDTEHDTACLGEVLMQKNSPTNFGGIGIASRVTAYFSHFYMNSSSASFNLPGAISQMSVLSPGAVVVIEGEIPGPAHAGRASTDEFGVVPVEYDQSTYQTILTMTGNGIHIIEPAGNGTQNLDDPMYQGMFTVPSGAIVRNMDSGAIFVGGGYPDFYFGAGATRARVTSSNWGTGLDLQGWGAGILTTGYGDLYNDGSPYNNDTYTKVFNGTSGASPIVAGADILMNAANYQMRGIYLSPRKIRKKLRKNSNPQGSYQGDPNNNPTNERIGPLPDLKNALGYLLPPAQQTSSDDDPNQYPTY